MGSATYPYGDNKIVYQANNFSTGLVVTARLWDNALVEFEDSPFTLTELGYGLYYLDITMDRQAIYHGVFFEGGTPQAYTSFRIVTVLR